jgi:hypothetical protein
MGVWARSVHTHALGRAVWLRRPAMDANSSDVELMRRSPQLPQGFAPLNDMVIIHPGDHLRATCWCAILLARWRSPPLFPSAGV